MKRIRIGVYLDFLYTMADNFLSGGFLHICCICADRIAVAVVEYKMFILLTTYKMHSFFESKPLPSLSLAFR